MARTNNTCYVSIAMSKEEKKILDDAVKRAGVNRNRFLRNFIATLVVRK